MHESHESQRHGARVLLLQAVYYIVTGIWPLVHLRSFMWVTGPKTDTWLVKTFGALVAAFGAGVLISLRRGDRAPLQNLSAVTALALLVCEVYYVLKGRISPVYLVDVVPNGAVCAYWLSRSYGPRSHDVPAGSLSPRDTTGGSLRP